MQIRKRGKDPKVKPILINKEDPSCFSDPSAVPDSTTTTTVANHFEEMHPKDEFELMHSSLVAEKVSLPTNVVCVGDVVSVFMSVNCCDVVE